MQVFGIYGSPRENGNTDIMLDSFLDGAAESGAEIRTLYVRDIKIGGCLSCGYCDRMGTCFQKDDMHTVYPLLRSADRIVVSAPVYFYGVPGQLKLLIDRSQAMYMRREIERKAGQSVPGTNRGGFLLSAGATKGKRLFECSVLTVKYFYDALGVPWSGDLCFRELEQKGAVQNHPEFLAQCHEAGKAFALL